MTEDRSPRRLASTSDKLTRPRNNAGFARPRAGGCDGRGFAGPGRRLRDRGRARLRRAGSGLSDRRRAGLSDRRPAGLRDRGAGLRAERWPCEPNAGHASRTLALPAERWPCQPSAGLASRRLALRAERWPCEPSAGHASRTLALRAEGPGSRAEGRGLMKTRVATAPCPRARQLLARGMLRPAAAVELYGQRGDGEEADLKLRRSRSAGASASAGTRYWYRKLPRLAAKRGNGLLRAQLSGSRPLVVERAVSTTVVEMRTHPGGRNGVGSRPLGNRRSCRRASQD